MFIENLSAYFNIFWHLLIYFLLVSVVALKVMSLQEPFVNIPEDTIREALKVVLGTKHALSFFFKIFSLLYLLAWRSSAWLNRLIFIGSKNKNKKNLCCRCQKSSNSYSLQTRKGKEPDSKLLLLHVCVSVCVCCVCSCVGES